MTTTAIDSLSPAAREFVDEAPHGLLIGGDFVPAADGRTFETSDPSTGETICDVSYAGREDVDRAVKAATVAMDGDWGRAPASQRERLMNRLADLIDEHAQQLAELESLDNGKPVGMALNVDVASSAAHFRYYAGWPTKIEGETIPVTWPQMFVYTRKEPVGVC